MNTKQQVILELLHQNQEGMTGLELVKNSRGKLKRGTVYVYLHQLETDGLVSSVPLDETSGRRKYAAVGKNTPAYVRTAEV